MIVALNYIKYLLLGEVYAFFFGERCLIPVGIADKIARVGSIYLFLGFLTSFFSFLSSLLRDDTAPS